MYIRTIHKLQSPVPHLDIHGIRGLSKFAFLFRGESRSVGSVVLRGEGDQPILEDSSDSKLVHHSAYPNFYDTLVHNPYSNRYLAIRRVPVRGIWITATLQSSTPRLQSRFDSCRRKDPPENGRRFRFTAAAIQRTFYGKLGGRRKGGDKGTAIYRYTQGLSMYQKLLAQPSTDVCTSTPKLD